MCPQVVNEINCNLTNLRQLIKANCSKLPPCTFLLIMAEAFL